MPYPVWPRFQGLAQGATREQRSVSIVEKPAFGAANHSAHWCAGFPLKKDVGAFAVREEQAGKELFSAA